MNDLIQVTFDDWQPTETEQPTCYIGLPPETVLFLKQRALRIKGVTAQAANDIGGELEAARNEYRHNKHGGFESWVESETDLSRATAYNCIDVHTAFGNCVNFTQLGIAKSAQYLLAAPSTPQEARDEAIQRAEAGEKITHTTAKEIIEAQAAQKRAEEAERKTRDDLTRQIEALQQQVDTITTPEIKYETPLEVQTELEKLREQRDNLSKRTEQLGADLDTLREATEAKREQEMHNSRILQNWRKVTETYRKNTVTLLSQFPSSIDAQVFEGDDWLRLSQMKDLAYRFIGECDNLSNSPRNMIIDAG